MKSYLQKFDHMSSPILYKNQFIDVRDVKLSQPYQQFCNSLSISKFTEVPIISQQQINSMQSQTQYVDQKLNLLLQRQREYLKCANKTVNQYQPSDILVIKLQKVSQSLDNINNGINSLFKHDNASSTQVQQIQSLKDIFEQNIEQILENNDAMLSIQQKLSPLSQKLNKLEIKFETVIRNIKHNSSIKQQQLQSADGQEITVDIKTKVNNYFLELQQQYDKTIKEKDMLIETLQAQVIQHQKKLDSMQTQQQNYQNAIVEEQSKTKCQKEFLSQIQLLKQQAEAKEIDLKQEFSRNQKLVEQSTNHNNELEQLIQELQSEKGCITQQVTTESELIKDQIMVLQNETKIYQEKMQLIEAKNLIQQQEAEQTIQQYKQSIISLQIENETLKEKIVRQNVQLNEKQKQSQSSQQLEQKIHDIEVIQPEKYLKYLNLVKRKIQSLINNKNIVGLMIQDTQIANTFQYLIKLGEIQLSDKQQDSEKKEVIQFQKMLTGPQISKIVISLLRDMKAQKLLRRNSFDDFLQIINAVFNALNDKNIKQLCETLLIMQQPKQSIKQCFLHYVQNHYNTQLEFFLISFVEGQTHAYNVLIPNLKLQRSQSQIGKTKLYLTDQLSHSIEKVFFDLSVQLAISGFEIDLEQQPDPGNIIVWPRMVCHQREEQVAVVQLKAVDISE